MALFRPRTTSDALDDGLLKMMVEDTAAARSLVLRNQKEILAARTEMEGGMVAAGGRGKSGIAMADDGGILYFDKTATYHFSLSAITDIGFKSRPPSLFLNFDPRASNYPWKLDGPGVVIVEFATDESLGKVKQTLGMWWSLHHPETS